VSLEAIFLSTFVLMSQNESARNDEQREHNDHLTDLWSEAWAEMIGEKLGIDSADVRKRFEQHVRDEQKGAARCPAPSGIRRLAPGRGRRRIASRPRSDEHAVREHRDQQDDHHGDEEREGKHLEQQVQRDAEQGAHQPERQHHSSEDDQQIHHECYLLTAFVEWPD
jgi:uncharacterized membrane protein